MLQLTEITEVEVLDLDKVSLEFFEEVTNPKILNYKVNMLSYERVNFDLLNDSIIKNISLIGPKDLHLSGLNLNSNPIRILSNLPENITVNFNFNFVEDITFKFSNSEIGGRDHKGTSTLYGRNVGFKYGLNDFYSDDVLFLDNRYICIGNGKNMIITNFKKKNETTKFSPEILSMINSKCENYFIITVNSLSEIRLNAFKFTRLLSNELNKKYFSALSSSTKIVTSLESLEEIVKFNEMSSYVPKHCELQFYVSVYPLNNEDWSDLTIFFQTISKFKLRIALFNSGVNFNIISSFLKNPYIQSSLQKFECLHYDMNESLEILSLGYNGKNLNTIRIIFTDDSEEIEIERFDEERKKILLSNENIEIIEIEHRADFY